MLEGRELDKGVDFKLPPPTSSSATISRAPASLAAARDIERHVARGSTAPAVRATGGGVVHRASDYMAVNELTTSPPPS